MANLEVQFGESTRAVRGGGEPDPTTGAIVPPIVQSTTFHQARLGESRDHTYSRASNPTVSALERALGAIEHAPPSVCFASGLAAETALFLALCRSGDHVVVADVVYGGTVRLLRQLLAGLGIRSTFVDAKDLAALDRAIEPSTKLVFVETPANPTLQLCDLAAVAGVAKRRSVVLAVDNTFLTPVILRPLELGAHLSLYSTTKLIEGHNTAIGGAITSRDEELLERLRFVRKTVGSIQAPHDAWLTLRGLRTLPLRARKQSENALRIARFLERSEFAASVRYPGLASFPQRELAERQHGSIDGSGPLHGNVVAFEVRGGLEGARRVVESLELCTLAESLGAVETLVTHPATMTHGDVPLAERERLGISSGLIRLSVGLEDPVDVENDLEHAFARAFADRGTASRLTAEVSRG